MSQNAQKTPLARSLEQFLGRRLPDGIQATGRGLPASLVRMQGALAVVKLEVDSAFTLPQLLVPVAGSEYYRQPLQPGCRGRVSASDARLGAVSGQTGGASTLGAPANLGALVFEPISGTDWSAVDPDVAVVYGPSGVTLYDSGQNSVVEVTPSGVTVTTGVAELTVTPALISMQIGAISVQVTPAGIILNGPVLVNGPITTAGIGGIGTGDAEISGSLKVDGASDLMGTTTIQSKDFLTHEHINGGGTGNSGTVA